MDETGVFTCGKAGVSASHGEGGQPLRAALASGVEISSVLVHPQNRRRQPEATHHLSPCDVGLVDAGMTGAGRLRSARPVRRASRRARSQSSPVALVAAHAALAGRRDTIRHVHNTIIGQDVVIAIIGGTLLGLALTRPRFGWVQRLDDSWRRSVEVLTTIVAFMMGGYAYGALFVVLHRQLGSDVHNLLRGAGFFFAIYALFVHFEPFAEDRNWRERGSAIFLYLALAITSLFAGVVLVEYTLTKAVHARTTLIEMAVLMVVAGGLRWLARRSRRGITDSAHAEGELGEPLPASGEAR